jgi:hypothetical protein
VNQSVSNLSGTDPSPIVADMLVKLQNPASPKRATPEQIARELKAQADELAAGDLSRLEMMLATQAHVLHHLFTRSTERYAEEALPERAKVFIDLALKAQTYCRLTVAALARLKKTGSAKGIVPLMERVENEVLTRPNGISDEAWAQIQHYHPIWRARREEQKKKKPVASAEEWIAYMKGRAEGKY